VEAGKLNHLLHIDDDVSGLNGSGRGVVIHLPKSVSGDRFQKTFSMPADRAAADQFHCADYAAGDDRFRWVLVQLQAACDFAQKQPGPLPFCLGLEMPEGSRSSKRKPPAAVWESPAFELGGSVRILVLNARFQTSFTARTASRAKPVYRLRELVLNGLAFQLHQYGARPGIISFREQKTKPAAKVHPQARAVA
jgi:hypothetical protein